MKKHLLMAVASVAAMTIASCVSGHTDSPAMMAGIDPAKFVAEVDGKPTALYCIKSSTGMEVAITNYGGRIVALEVPGRDGKMRDVVLGFDSIQAYLPENNRSEEHTSELQSQR